MTLKQLMKLLSKNEITPTDLIRQSIEVIESKNKYTNAVIHPRFEKALEEAKHDYANTLFKGIPILIKCLGQELAGEPSTNGSVIFENSVSAYTNNFVKKLQDLGFIIIGQTNAPEFGFKNISDSPLYGNVLHPLDNRYSPGGSSGGSAAAVYDDMVVVSAASDGGGSIRIPASYCGLVGLKPTRGSMPSGPYGYRGWQGASVNFFLTKDIDDCELLFHAMKTNQKESPFNYFEDAHKLNKKVKIAYSYDSPINMNVSDDAKNALNLTVSLLKDLGYDAIHAKPNIDNLRLMKTYYLVNAVETAAMFKKVERLLNRKLTKDDMQLTSWVMYQYGLTVDGYELVDALNFWDQVSAEMYAFHREYDVYITPTTAFTAPRIDTQYQDAHLLEKMKNIELIENKYQVLWDMFEKSLEKTPYTMLANITGQPAISIPLYTNDEGFLLGTQLFACKGEERLLFELSKKLLSLKRSQAN